MVPKDHLPQTPRGPQRGGLKNFLKSLLLVSVSGLRSMQRLFRRFRRNAFKRGRTSSLTVKSTVVVRDPFSKLVRQALALGLALLIITALPPANILETGFTADYFPETDFLDEGVEQTELPSFIMNEEGFVLKTSPASEEVSRIGFSDTLIHTVAPGDTLSQIASLYNISIRTLLWENNISETASLRIGTKLTIPPVDGITHSTGKKDTLGSIAKDYGVEESLIREHNNLEGDLIVEGKKLFIPGGKKKAPPAPVIARTPVRTDSSGRVIAKTQTAKAVLSPESACAKFQFPTVGKITQGFHAGHYANDIGNQAKPDVNAACGGTVVKIVTGCPARNVRLDRSCGGGYGNHVVIDHGGKTQTLYAHLDTVYVAGGQQVGIGEPIGRMGNSGRAYGATGIHLHFEVSVNGQKRNPAQYF
ncbi:hypothetical protein CO046_03490 [Candidatus Peregrinibacteria bacterium CG_4_9_14_0_2_um_filter_53_11]|nr:MAG: hypothetical protein CO046_03490 [Candidatus Peregrinibacteria bacterium CG_4_9_14_0_2_um_filter_53_11]